MPSCTCIWVDYTSPVWCIVLLSLLAFSLLQHFCTHILINSLKIMFLLSMFEYLIILLIKVPSFLPIWVWTTWIFYKLTHQYQAPALFWTPGNVIKHNVSVCHSSHHGSHAYDNHFMTCVSCNSWCVFHSILSSSLRWTLVILIICLQKLVCVKIK